MDDPTADLAPADYDTDEDLVRRPLLTFSEARDILDLLRQVSGGSGPEAVEARRLAHLLAYRVPEA